MARRFRRRKMRAAARRSPVAPKKPTRYEELQPFREFFAKSDAPCRSMVEVGTNAGDAVFLWRELFETVYVVDAWNTVAYDGTASPQDAMSRRSQGQFDAIESLFDARFGGDPHVVKIKAFSVDAAREFSRQVDFVYVDARHDYESVLEDVAAWRPHCARWLGGHDYHEAVWPGVFRAVNEALGEPHVVFPDTSWLVDLSRIRSDV